MIRFVSVRALSDEATISSRFNPEMERCPHTGNVSRLWLFAFPGPYSARQQAPNRVARNKTVSVRGRKVARCKTAKIRLSRRIYKTGGDHPSRMVACRFRASGLNLGIPYRGVGGAFG